MPDVDATSTRSPRKRSARTQRDSAGDTTDEDENDRRKRVKKPKPANDMEDDDHELPASRTSLAGSGQATPNASTSSLLKAIGSSSKKIKLERIDVPEEEAESLITEADNQNMDKYGNPLLGK